MLYPPLFSHKIVPGGGTNTGNTLVSLLERDHALGTIRAGIYLVNHKPDEFFWAVIECTLFVTDRQA